MRELVLFALCCATVAISVRDRAVIESASVSTPTIENVQDILIYSFGDGLSGVHVANTDVRLSVGADATLNNEQVLTVAYPAPTADPAARDVRINAKTTDWSAGKAIQFRAKSAKATRLSVSFIDRNGVVYTSWADVAPGTWQLVRIPFESIRPNPYFQPPGAKTGSPLDVRQVNAIAFAPQDRAAGHFSVGSFVIVRQ